MPIPSPAPYRRSNLSKQQKQDELNAIYGVTMPKLTDAEIQRMREMLATHDAEAGEEAEFDPSKVRAPYVFRKFPMMVYNHAKSHAAYDTDQTVMRGSLAVMERVHVKAHLASKTVTSQAELEAAIRAGYSEDAPSFPEQEESEEEAQTGEQLHKRGPGRPRRESAA